MDDKILQELRSTSVYQHLKDVKGCYSILEKKQKIFCESFHIQCMDCNGDCCRHFTPDITDVEAEFLAYGLLREGKADLVLELLKYRDDTAEYCPMFIEDSQYHCAVYRWRPLICRLFGASAIKDKNMNPSFRSCKWNRDRKDISEEEFIEQQNAIVYMSDFGEMVQSIDPGRSKTYLLQDILPDTINKLRFLLEYTQD